eukprot:2780446-Rhodomonas_salina.4
MRHAELTLFKPRAHSSNQSMSELLKCGRICDLPYFKTPCVHLRGLFREMNPAGSGGTAVRAMLGLLLEKSVKWAGRGGSRLSFWLARRLVPIET